MIANAMLVISGAACLILSGFILYLALPRHGRPDSAWTRTEARAMGMAMLMMLLLFAGISMVVKGIF
jgi:hypothetical protein